MEYFDAACNIRVPVAFVRWGREGDNSLYVPETDKVAEEAVIPVDKRDLAVACVESDVEEGGIE